MMERSPFPRKRELHLAHQEEDPTGLTVLKHGKKVLRAQFRDDPLAQIILRLQAVEEHNRRQDARIEGGVIRKIIEGCVQMHFASITKVTGEAQRVLEALINETHRLRGEEEAQRLRGLINDAVAKGITV